MAELTTITSIPKEDRSQNHGHALSGLSDAAQAYPFPASQEPNLLERYISFPPILALGLTAQASWEAIAITFQSAFLNGGPVALVYGMITVTIGNTALAATLGEMAAVDPAVGAQYRWSARYAPENLKPRFWGFMQGWLTFVAWVAACASSPYAFGSTVQAVIVFNNPTYVPKSWHATLLMWAIIAVGVIANCYARKLLVVIELVGGLVHIGFFLATVITLGVLVPRNSNQFVWETAVSGVSGWNSQGVGFCLGLLSPAFAVGGFDGIIHMSDETKQAPAFVPRGMVATVLINGLLGFGFIVCLLYTLGDPTVTLDPTKSSLPIITVFFNATQSVAATNTLMSFILIVIGVSVFSILASVSRLTWAFARDGGLPFAEFFARIHPQLQVPLNALGLVALLCVVLAVINIGSTVALYAIFSLAIFALYISYMPPITFLILRKLKGEPIGQGPWQLGRFSIYINVFALCFAVFMIIWLPFPTMVPVTGSNMNYASVVWGGCILLGLLDFCIFGHKRFRLKA